MGKSLNEVSDCLFAFLLAIPLPNMGKWEILIDSSQDSITEE